MDISANQNETQYRKLYVDVLCLHTRDAKVIPKEIYLEDGKRFEIDKVIEACRCASLKVGGVGVRYTVKIKNKQTYLFYDNNEDLWFVEAKK